MKLLKLVAIAFALTATISCKKEQKDSEVITIDTTEKAQKKEIADNATLAKVQFNIEGMTCAKGCAAKIEKSLNNMEGVKTASVDFESKTAVVEYDVDQINTNLLAERVVANGSSYKAMNFSSTTSKTCTPDCKKECCSKDAKKCVTKCNPDCTKVDCEKCAIKTAECKAKCTAKKLEPKTCKPDCKKECCKTKA